MCYRFGLLLKIRELVSKMSDQTNNKAPKASIQVEIMRRYMSNHEFDKFIGKYNDNRKTAGGMRDRAENLKVKITDEQMACLESYLDDTDVTLRELDKQAGKRPSYVSSTAMRTAVKFLYQNRTLLRK